MIPESEAGFSRKEWDWRPLARLIAWALFAAAWSHHACAVSLSGAAHALCRLLLLWLLSFGVLTHILAVVVMGAFRLALELDEAAYGLAERLVRPWTGRASFTANFLAAYAAELGLVLGAVHLWRAADMGSRVMSLSGGILR